MEEKKYITRQEAANRLHVTKQTISNFVSRGFISGRTIMRQTQVLEEDVEKIRKDIDIFNGNSELLTQYNEQLRKEVRDARQKIKETINSVTDIRLLSGHICMLIKSILESNRRWLKLREHQLLDACFNHIDEYYNIVDELAYEYTMTKGNVRRAINIAFEHLVNAEKEKEDYIHVLEKENSELRDKIRINNCDKMPIINKKFKYNILTKKIKDIKFSRRVLNALHSAGIDTVSDIVLINKIELTKIRNLGKKSIYEIEDVLEDMGLRLGMSMDELYTIDKSSIPNKVYLTQICESNKKNVVFTTERLNENDILFVKAKDENE